MQNRPKRTSSVGSYPAGRGTVGIHRNRRTHSGTEASRGGQEVTLEIIFSGFYVVRK